MLAGQARVAIRGRAVQGNGDARSFRGDFETHLTVAAAASDFAALQTLAAGLGARFLHIVLPRGQTPSQPMLSWRDRGELSVVRELAARRGARLQQAGHHVTRCKIEAAPDNAGIPQDEFPGPDQYFESHLKIALAGGDDIAAVTALAQRHAAHLSRNALRRDEGGCEQRFVTQRLPGAGLRRARAGMDALAAALTALGHAPLRSELEFVVYDSNQALDAGWMDGGS